jgi:hypothetical protein
LFYRDATQSSFRRETDANLTGSSVRSSGNLVRARRQWRRVTDPVDVVTGTAATGNVNVASGSVMSNAGKLIFGAALFSARGTSGPGFTQRSALQFNVTEDKPFVAPGVAEANFAIVTGPPDWIAQMVVLK